MVWSNGPEDGRGRPLGFDTDYTELAEVRPADPRDAEPVWDAEVAEPWVAQGVSAGGGARADGQSQPVDEVWDAEVVDEPWDPASAPSAEDVEIIDPASLDAIAERIRALEQRTAAAAAPAPPVPLTIASPSLPTEFGPPAGVSSAAAWSVTPSGAAGPAGSAASFSSLSDLSAPRPTPSAPRLVQSAAAPARPRAGGARDARPVSAGPGPRHADRGRMLGRLPPPRASGLRDRRGRLAVLAVGLASTLLVSGIMIMAAGGQSGDRGGGPAAGAGGTQPGGATATSPGDPSLADGSARQGGASGLGRGGSWNTVVGPGDVAPGSAPVGDGSPGAGADVAALSLAPGSGQAGAGGDTSEVSSTPGRSTATPTAAPVGGTRTTPSVSSAPKASPSPCQTEPVTSFVLGLAGVPTC